MQDLSYFALDDQGAEVFRLFLHDLQTLDRVLEAEPYAAWRITPRMLEANINA